MNVWNLFKGNNKDNKYFHGQLWTDFKHFSNIIDFELVMSDIQEV